MADALLRLCARDTTTGALVWTVELDRPFGSLVHTGPTVLVTQPPAERIADPWAATESVVVVDAASGEVVRTVPTELEILHAG